MKCVFVLSEIQFITQYEAGILNCIARAFSRALKARICSYSAAVFKKMKGKKKKKKAPVSLGKGRRDYHALVDYIYTQKVHFTLRETLPVVAFGKN